MGFEATVRRGVYPDRRTAKIASAERGIVNARLALERTTKVLGAAKAGVADAKEGVALAKKVLAAANAPSDGS